MKRSALLVALGVIAAAVGVVAFTSRSSGKTSVRLATARFPGGISLRYPAAWTRVNWCQSGLHVTPIAVLTSTRPGPRCPKSLNVTWPPSVRLAENGVAVVLAGFAPPDPTYWKKFKANARIGGKPANLTKSAYGHGGACPGGVRSQGRAAFVGGYWIAAIICGPDLAVGEASVRDLFASIHFAGTS